MKESTAPTLTSKISVLIIKRLAEGSARTVTTRKNIIASFFIKGLSIAINLLIVPLTIDYVNPERYGVWITLSSIVMWFSFFDVGLGNGLRNKIAEAKALGNKKLIKVYVSTTYAILAIIFLSVWVIFLLLNRFINWSTILNTSAGISNELNILALIVVTYFCFQMIFKTVSILLLADQKPALSSIIDLFGNALALFIIFLLTKFTHGSLVYLGLAMGGAPILILFLYSIFLFLGKYHEYRPSIYCIDFREGRNIMSLGIIFFIIQIAVLIIYQTNNIVIVQLFGPGEVTVYNIAYKYFGIMSMIFMIIINPFWSAFTDAYTSKDNKWMEQSIRKLEKVWLLIAFAGVPLLIGSEKAYSLWIGNKVTIPVAVSVLMYIYYIVFTRFNLYIYLLNGIGKIKLQLLVYIILAVLNIPVVIFLGNKLGLAGIVLGNCLISIPHMIYSPVQLKKLIRNDATGIWLK